MVTLLSVAVVGGGVVSGGELAALLITVKGPIVKGEAPGMGASRNPAFQYPTVMPVVVLVGFISVKTIV